MSDSTKDINRSRNNNRNATGTAPAANRNRRGGACPSRTRNNTHEATGTATAANGRSKPRPYGDSRNNTHKPTGTSTAANGRGKPLPYGTQNRSQRTNDTRPQGTDDTGMPARRAAYRVLWQVTQNGAWASLALNEVLTASGLSALDRRLVTRLVYDTLDRLLTLDHALSQIMTRQDTDPKLMLILRLGACQILLEDRIPESAAVDTSVRLCVEQGMEGLKGVCNGILRNLIRRKDELTYPDPAAEPDLAASLKYSLPVWLVRRLRADRSTEAEPLMAYRATEAPFILRPNFSMGEDPAEAAASLDRLLEKKVWQSAPGALPFSRYVTGAADISRDTDFLSGRFSLQSEGSMLACLAMDARRGGHYLDACAAPGGKTCFLAEQLDGTGRVQAWDIHDHRVALISAQATRLHLENVRPMIRDATVFREQLVETMDGVLLDAPCSGLGMMAAKPDIRLRVTEESVAELVELQSKLLETVCQYVRPGGTLVYSTCSVLRAENEDQVTAFLAKHPEFEEIALPETIPERFRGTLDPANPGLQLLPHRDGIEGFYVCRMRRKK